jgi:subtilase family serine protease
MRAQLNRSPDGDTLPFQNVSWPASSPLVTSAGGTNLFFGTATNADPNGSYQGEQVWNDGFGAGGGGMSIPAGWGTPNFGVLGTILADPSN